MADNTNRRSGTIYVKVDGKTLELNGSFSYNLGGPKRSTKKGPTQRYGYKEEAQDCWLEGEVMDSRATDVKKDLIGITNSTVILSLANEKDVVFSNAWWAADGDIGTDESNIQTRFEALEAEEILP